MELVSLLSLIQTPDIYDGQLVRVVALASVEFEKVALWGAQEYLDNFIPKNAVWLSLDDFKTYLPLNGRTVIVEGTFTSHSNGHLGLFTGTIESVTRIEAWQP
ncbi:MAG: hypothetical protein AAGI88_02250 [Pseudomonadota bacterium]